MGDLWTATVKPFPKDLTDSFRAAAEMPKEEVESFERRRKEKQENCLHKGGVYSFGPTLGGDDLDIQMYFCVACGLSTNNPIGKYKGTSPMTRSDLHKMIQRTYVD